MQNAFQNAMEQLEKVTKIKNFSDDFIKLLKQPDREIIISIPVKNRENRLPAGFAATARVVIYLTSL